MSTENVLSIWWVGVFSLFSSSPSFSHSFISLTSLLLTLSCVSLFARAYTHIHNGRKRSLLLFAPFRRCCGYIVRVPFPSIYIILVYTRKTSRLSIELAINERLLLLLLFFSSLMHFRVIRRISFIFGTNPLVKSHLMNICTRSLNT